MPLAYHAVSLSCRLGAGDALGPAPRRRIQPDHLLQGVGGRRAHGVHHPGHKRGNVQDSDPPLQESRHRDLVGGTQDGGCAATRAQRLAGKPQGGEPVEVRLEKIQLPQHRQVQPA